MPKRSPTFICEFSFAKIFAKTPFYVASKATVALSVSISQSESPSENYCPYFTFHLTIFPYDIVGLKAGILSIISLIR
jgi:hypothetical protein